MAPSDASPHPQFPVLNQPCLSPPPYPRLWSLFLDIENHKSLLETVTVHTHTFLAVPSHIGSLNLMEKAKRFLEWVATCHLFSSINSLFCPRSKVVYLYLIIDPQIYSPNIFSCQPLAIFSTCWWIPQGYSQLLFRRTLS